MDKDKHVKAIDLAVIVREIIAHRKLFYWTLPSVFVASCLLIICVPRTYSSGTKLAPELENSKGSSMISSLASSFGMNLDAMQTSDAITPLLYPDLMEDNKFVTELFGITVESADGAIKTTYYDYLCNHMEHPWWTYAIGAVKKLFESQPDEEGNAGGDFDPYHMSKRDEDIAGMVRNSISIDIDKKSGVIEINTKAQDKLICKTLADSTRTLLQRYITDYRTNKARIDLKYYHKLTIETKAEYEQARQEYGRFCDQNTEVVLTSYRSMQEQLENEMQLKYNSYSMMSTQYQDAKARVQEQTPAFTILKGASVPIRPSGPKRMFFVLAMTALAFFLLSLYAIRGYLLKD